MKAYLILSDGSVFEGQSFGAQGTVVGETVFSTGMTGYQEVLTDPSFFGQMVCLTYPLQGNYGANSDDGESTQIWPSALIVRDWCETPSNWRCEISLDQYLKQQGIPGIYGIDTRRLTRILRDNGTMNGALVCGDDVDVAAWQAKAAAYTIEKAVPTVTRKEKVVLPAEGEKRFRVALWDFGAKSNIARSLRHLGCEVTIFPADTKAQEIASGGFDGLMLTNGPGDPAENTDLIEELKKLMDKKIPTFGICLGHQLLALSQGARTEKLKYGHRGANHPVKDLAKDRTYITSQNHGYTIVPDSLPKEVGTISHINLNDGTVEGVRYAALPAYTVQFHPEACPGPRDTDYLFREFIEFMEKGGKH